MLVVLKFCFMNTVRTLIVGFLLNVVYSKQHCVNLLLLIIWLNIVM